MSDLILVFPLEILLLVFIIGIGIMSTGLQTFAGTYFCAIKYFFQAMTSLSLVIRKLPPVSVYSI